MMRRVFQYDGEVFGILSKGYSYLVLNLCFLIGCLPIVTIGVSTVAAYNVALDSIEGEDKPIIQSFIKYFKVHFRLGIFTFLGGIAWLLMLAAGLRVFINTPLQYLFMLLIAFSLVFLNTLFLSIAYFSENVTLTFRYTSALCLKYLGIFCLGTGVAFCSLLIPIFLPKLLFLWLFLGFSLPLVFSSKLFLVGANRMFETVTDGKDQV